MNIYPAFYLASIWDSIVLRFYDKLYISTRHVLTTYVAIRTLREQHARTYTTQMTLKDNRHKNKLVWQGIITSVAVDVLRRDTKGWVEIWIILSITSRVYIIQFFTLLHDIAYRKFEACGLYLPCQKNKHLSVHCCVVRVTKEIE